jgi:hypothetical protein
MPLEQYRALSASERRAALEARQRQAKAGGGGGFCCCGRSRVVPVGKGRRRGSDSYSDTDSDEGGGAGAKGRPPPPARKGKDVELISGSYGSEADIDAALAAALGEDATETRVDVAGDGGSYSRAKFIEEYGGTEEWDAAAPEPPAVTIPDTSSEEEEDSEEEPGELPSEWAEDVGGGRPQDGLLILNVEEEDDEGEGGEQGRFKGIAEYQVRAEPAHSLPCPRLGETREADISSGL